MTSQISMHKLLKLELKQNSWILALNTLLHLLAGPVLFLLDGSHDTNNDTARARLMTSFFTNEYAFSQLLIIIICIAIDIYLFRYLFFRRTVDLYHSMPISRKQLFTGKYLCGFLLWFLPFMVNLVCVMVLTVAYLGDLTMLGMVFKGLLQALLLLILCFFIYYHLFLLAVTISGNILNLFVNVAIMGFVVFTLSYLLYGCASSYWDTYCYQVPAGLIDSLLSLSPFLSPWGMWLFINQGIIGQHWLLFALSFFLMPVMGILSYLLYLKRPSELAERGTTSKAYTLLSRILTALLAGVGGGILFGSLAPDHTAGWHIFGTLLCTPLAYGLLSCTFQTSIKAFFQHKPALITTTIASTFIILSFQQDWFGYDSYMPDIDQIAGIAVNNCYYPALNDGSSQLVLNEEGQLTYMQNPPQVIGELYTDPLTCANLLNEFVNGDYGINGSSYYYVKVALKNGKSYTRYYYLDTEKAGMLTPLIETQDYKNNHYKFSTGALGYPEAMSIRCADGSNSKVLDKYIKPLMDAYKQDFEENYGFQDLTDYLYVATLKGEYTVYEDDGTSYVTHPNLPVKLNYTRTLEVLREIDIFNLYLTEQPTQLHNLTLYFDIVSGDLEAAYNYLTYGDYAPSVEEDSQDFNAEQAYVTAAEETRVPAQCIITDPELLDKLLPYLYFGNYTNLYPDADDYFYIGEAQIHENMVVNVYKKPGELPAELFLYLENFLTVEY